MIPTEELKTYFKNDKFAEHLGIEILDASPGRAKARMKIEAHHLNALDIVHGGAIFALADLAFAVASNTHGKISVAINVSISYIKACKSPVIYADAQEISKNHKLGTYRIDITDNNNEIIAVFMGTGYRKQAHLQVNLPQ